MIRQTRAAVWRRVNSFPPHIVRRAEENVRMTVKQAMAGGMAMACCLACLVLGSPAVRAQPDPLARLDSPETLQFDIPAQTLGDALDAYSVAAGLSVLIVSDAASQPVPALRGRLTRKQALAALLAGSGLAPYFVDNRSIVVRPAPGAGQAPVPQARLIALGDIPGVHDGADHRGYVAQVQDTVRAALCSTAATRPGGYRLGMQLWVDARGRIARLNLLGTTGAPARDGAIGQALQGLAVGAEPAADMPQPVLMLLLPAGPDASLDCPAAGTAVAGS